ncbi:hypothetical protein PVAG01_01743 [Phlyctema vagabunda]|uniref:Transmembrane protein n=1 Tax=Phlyctema vagabunda TaxID=108571 RepID=A0ABR4PXZ0_9HELO
MGCVFDHHPEKRPLKPPLCPNVNYIKFNNIDLAVVVIMAGAIFGILMMFLVGISSSGSVAEDSTSHVQRASQAAIQVPVLTNAVNHVMTMPQAVSTFGVQGVAKLTSEAHIAISNHIIPSFTRLIEFFGNTYKVYHLDN